MAVRISRRIPLSRYSSAGSLLGVLAIACGVGSAAYMLGNNISSNRSSKSSEPHKAYVAEFNTVAVPVPLRPVPAGTSAKDIKFRLERFPEHQLPNGAVRDIKQLGDGVTLVALPGGLPIIEANIGSQDEATNPILGRIPPGMRAMTVKVDATAAVEGWARSGSIIDVLLVEKSRTTVVAEQVRVISTERSLSPIEVSRGNAGSGVSVPSTVTLLVTQEQCLAINTAVPLGKIAFALRSLKDDERWRDTHFSSDDLAESKKPARAARIGGVVTFGSGVERKSYALVDGAWVPSDSVPQGFFN